LFLQAFNLLAKDKLEITIPASPYRRIPLDPTIFTVTRYSAHTATLKAKISAALNN
jgi:hypothetical protein